MTAGVLSGLFLLLVGAGVAMADPALAVDDPSRPDARVTHGPSCRPGGLVVEVTAGTVPYSVRLATTRTPGGEDEATLAPGATVVLRSDDVDWGETIDGRLEYTAQDGSGVTYVDELDNYSFTRPTQEDCAAVAAPTDAEPAPAAPAAEAPDQPTPSVPSQGTDGPPLDSVDSGVPAVPPVSTGSASSDQVAPGGTVTVHGTGFLPGEQVVVQLGDAVLAAATAGADGTVHADVRIPEATATGPTTLGLVGDDSAVTADVALEVAAASESTDGAGTLVPLVAAAGALVGSVAGLVSVAGRRRTGGGSAVARV